MTPQVATAPVDSASGGKDLPGGVLPTMLAGALEMPFSSTLAVLQSPLLAGDGQGQDPVAKDPVDPITDPVMPTDPSSAALAAVLQWLRQSAPAALSKPHDGQCLTPAPKDKPVLASADAGAAAFAATLPTLLTTQFKGAAKSESTGIADGSTGCGPDATVGAPTYQGKAGDEGTATASASSLTPDLRGLADLLNLAAPEHDSVRLPRDDVLGAKFDPLTDSSGTLMPVVDTTAAATTSSLAGAERTSTVRPGADTPVPQSERVVSVPVHDRRWSQAIAAQLLILVDHRIAGATLRLTPEHLGPVEVRIDIQDSQVNLNFGAAHSDTRTALEQALPRLREVLAGAGLTLGEASVQQQMRRGPQNRSEDQRRSAGVADQQPVGALGAVRALRLIDEYV